MATVKRMIDANKLIRLCQLVKKEDEPSEECCTALDLVIELLKQAPAVDAVEVVHGRWVEKPYLLGTTRYCSICGNNYGMPHGIFNYCPNCGAKMDGGNEDGSA